MQNTVITKLRGNIIIPLLLFSFWGGCSSPAPLENDEATTTSTSEPTRSAEKISDLSGLWLLPQIDGKVHDKWQSVGINVSPKEIYDPTGQSLHQAVVKINTGDSQAGTGSFVSPNGLLLTNYGSAIQGIAQNSAHNQNYIHDGFYANSQQQEIPLENYQLLITIEQKEVTHQINRQLSDTLTYHQKRQRKKQIQQQIIAERQADNNSLVVEINDSWGGNRQFMSVYNIVRDVRLVYTPSNPDLQTSASYAFLRAYVSPDGESRPYHKTNVPFQPNKHLTITEDKVTPRDITLTIGFPGETQRDESSFAIDFYQNNRNPVLIDTYKAILDAAQYAAKRDSSTAIQNAPLRSSVSHNLTYYRALQQGIDNQHIIKTKQTQEEKFAEWIKQDSLRNIKYRRVLSQLEQSYRIASQTGDLLFALVNTINHNKILQMAGLYHSYYDHISDTSNTVPRNQNKQELWQRHQNILNEINIEAQIRMLEDMLFSLSSLPDGKVPFHLIELFGNHQNESLKNHIRSYLERQKNQSIIFNIEQARDYLNLPVDSARNHTNDELITLYDELLNSYQFSRRNYSQHLSYLQPAQERYVQGLLNFRSDTITYPDANGTLRLSIGHVKELSAHTNGESISTVDNNGIVNFITTNDISGGSFGSPVLNSNGKLIGIVTQRRPESMANDLLFNPELSHTINMDIRCITSQISEMYNNSRLLKEMQVSGENCPKTDVK